MDLFIIIILSLVIFTGIKLFLKIRKKQYQNFLYKNSASLKKLFELNKKYNFFNIENFDDRYVYDNQVFYQNVSCEDYLTYQLQFKWYAVQNAIKNANKNLYNYNKYNNDVAGICAFGIYDTPIKGFNAKRLLHIEERLFNKNKLKPITNFHIKIILFCSKINGYIYAQKTQTFNSEEILSIIKSLNNKSGSFYNDKDIWDALCRVERGKVSNKMRFSIYKRDGYRCRYCGRTEKFDDLEIDHIKPIAKGGKTVYENLQTLCRRCNKNKGDKW